MPSPVSWTGVEVPEAFTEVDGGGRRSYCDAEALDTSIRSAGDAGDLVAAAGSAGAANDETGPLASLSVEAAASSAGIACWGTMAASRVKDRKGRETAARKALVAADLPRTT